MDFFSTANNITDPDKKKATFLSLCGPNTYKIIRSLVGPCKVSDKTYDQIIVDFKKLFSPKPSEIVCRYKIYRRYQQTGETLSVYLKELRKLAEPCSFGASPDIMLRDRLVCGITDESLQQKLLVTDKLKLKDAQDMYFAHEVAVERESESRADVNAVSFRKNQPGQFKPQLANRERKKCFRCEREHSPETCEHIKSTCTYCRKVGYIEIACFAKKKNQNHKLKVHQTTVESTSNTEPVSGNTQSVFNQSSDYEFLLNNVTSDIITGKYLVDVLLNDQKVKIEVDSGASYSVIGKSTYHKIFSENRPKIDKFSVILCDYQNTVITTLGSKILNADAFSRLPQKIHAPEPLSSDDVLMLENIPEKLICAKDIANETKKVRPY
ncbi:uncharacterized protein [Diabrotica undecimpunctata]|uniref:uncharacterized protein n=1 Tax=Diabrotica undecimpunctata TaxID=50387 RepID=UPI003B63B63B